MGWWHRASQAERLAQIDAAIELGLTTRVLAANVGACAGTVHGYALRFGRRFPNTAGRRRENGVYRHVGGEVVHGKRGLSVLQAKDAYLSGEPVDFWSAT